MRNSSRIKDYQTDNIMTINVKSNLELDPGAEKNKVSQKQVRDKWSNLNMDCIFYIVIFY